MSILSFDIGTVNLGVALVALAPPADVEADASLLAYSPPDETPKDFEARALRSFLGVAGESRCRKWRVLEWRRINLAHFVGLAEAGGGSISGSPTTASASGTNADADGPPFADLPMGVQAVALTAALRTLERDWFIGEAGAGGAKHALPATIVLESQVRGSAGAPGAGAALAGKGNAMACLVAMGIAVHFATTAPSSTIISKSGAHKMKVCEACGVFGKFGSKGTEMDGRPGAQAPTADARKRDNKRRAVQTAEKLVCHQRLLEARVAPDLARAASVFVANKGKQDDLADALLQGLWWLFDAVGRPPAPKRSRKRKAE